MKNMETELPLTQIRTDPGTQSRAHMDMHTILEYGDAIKENDGAWPFPPVIVFFDGTAHWLADGFHRAGAARQAKLAAIPADVREGTRRDAILYAAGANAEHGLKRSSDDKRNAVRTLLNDEEWGQWSDREIARQCKVSHPFVAKIRQEVTGNVSSERTYTNKHGDTAVMKTEKIGADRPQEAAGVPRYAPVWQLETRVKTWLAGEDVKKMGHDDPLDNLVDIKEKQVGWRVQWNNLIAPLAADQVQYRERDLRQACNNVLDQNRKSRNVRNGEQTAVETPKSDLDRRLDELDETLEAEVAEMLAAPPDDAEMNVLNQSLSLLQSLVINSEPPLTFAYNKAVMVVHDCIKALKEAQK